MKRLEGREVTVKMFCDILVVAMVVAPFGRYIKQIDKY